MEWPKGSWWPAARAGQAKGRYTSMTTAPKVGLHPCPLPWNRLILLGGSHVWVCYGKTQSVICIYLNLSCLLASTTQLEEESELGTRARSQAGGHGHWTYLDARWWAGLVSKAWFSLYSWWKDFMNTWNCSSPREFMKGETVFLFGFCFPLAQICYAHRCFLNRFNKGLLTTCRVPESHRICAVLEALCKMSKIWIWRTKHKFFLRRLLAVGHTCQHSVLAQGTPGQLHPGDKEGPFTAREKSQQQ